MNGYILQDEADALEDDQETEFDTSGSSDDDEDGQAAQHWDEAEEELERDITSRDQRKQHNKTSIAQQFVLWILSSLVHIQNKYLLSNACIEKLLQLFSQIFFFVGKCSKLFKAISNAFPHSLYRFRKLTEFDRDDFLKYIVCPNCTALYRYGDVVQNRDGRTVVNKCSNMMFGCRVDKSSANHGRRGKFRCDASLVQEVHLSNNKTKFYPLKTFCYKNIIDNLEQFLSRPGFEAECNKWRNREVIENHLGDLYDGDIWKEFQMYNGEPFLSQPNNYALMINVDWFQPFSRRRDLSLGVIYFVFMNLPRHLRFRMENIMLIGIIPSLKKEPGSLDYFLQPIINELNLLSRGFQISPANKDPVFVKVLLLCASSDIPAARKLAGFMGHAAIKGCSLCTISFQDNSGNRYCGPVDNNKWQKRTRDEHIRQAERGKNAPNLAKQNEIYKKFGYKSTALLELDYFEPSKFSVVEPMHNLFLGTAKRFFVHWVENELLTKADLELIGGRISELNVPADIGRLPTNIATNYSQFTADEWKNWVLLYSLFSLQGLLPERHLQMWQKFVLACRELCQPTMRKIRLVIADRLFLQVSRIAEELYGPAFLTPNMHLHGHLKETIECYGSIYGFWAFSFERFNGFLADFPTNKRSVEIQIMRKFQQIGFAADMKHKEFGEFSDFFTEFCREEIDSPKIPTPKLQVASEEPINRQDPLVWTDLSLLQVKQEAYTLVTMSQKERDDLKEMYECLYETSFPGDAIARVAKKYSTVYWTNEMYGSVSSSRCKNYKMLMAKWAGDDSKLDPHFGDIRPGKVSHYLMHSIEVNGCIKVHLLAVVEWFKKTNADLGYLHPITVWQKRVQNDGPASYIPIQRILGKCAWTIKKHGVQNFIVVSPLPRHVFS